MRRQDEGLSPTTAIRGESSSVSNNIRKHLVRIEVVVSPAEYGELWSIAAGTAPGTVSAAIREQLGWHAEPYGTKAGYPILDQTGHHETKVKN